MRFEETKVRFSILRKYFEDEASQKEAESIHNWLESDKNGAETEKSLYRLWNDMDPGRQEPEIDLEALLDQIHHSIHLSSGAKAKSRPLSRDLKPSISMERVLRNLARMAVVFMLPVMIYIGWEIFSQKMWVKSQAQVVFNEITCPLGAKSLFVLPDGTRGNLNNGSTLRYPAAFTGNTREVELYGEAFFDVEHNRQRPFIINTVGLDVKVLGTRLNIYSYRDEQYQEITLESGSVELIRREDNHDFIVAKMKPGQHAVYRFGAVEHSMSPNGKDKDLIIIESKEQMEGIVPQIEPGKQALIRLQEGDLYLENEKTEQYTGWTDGKLILRNDPMPVLLKRMERWYSVKFNILEEQIDEYTYWATFEDESIDQVLRLLSLTGPIRFDKRPREKMADGTFKTMEIDVSLKRTPSLNIN